MFKIRIAGAHLLLELMPHLVVFLPTPREHYHMKAGKLLWRT